MNRTVFLFVTLLCLCFSCTGKKQEEKVLLENFPPQGDASRMVRFIYG